jgi:hypothetical protein
MPDDKGSPPAPWSEKRLLCYKNGDFQIVGADAPGEENDAVDEALETRTCTPTEIARERAKYEQQETDRAAAKRAENEQMAKLFGIPGSDDESNRRFAANLMKQKGWRSVAYKGKGLFDVDYHFEGRLDQDFAFPLMPDSDLMIPFITLRPRTDGSVKVSAPAFVGGAGVFASRAKMMGLPNTGNDGPASRAEGRFTITTDGEILTNNSEDGPVTVQGRRQLRWDVGPGSDKVPEMMVRL